MANINYSNGDIVNGFLLVQQLDSVITKFGSWKVGIFKCSSCDNEFKEFFQYIRNKRNKICIYCSRKKASTTHGYAKTRLHNIWLGLKTRCKNPKDTNFERYGGRGIMVCEEWDNNYMSFHVWAIENKYDDTLTIDRINNNGNYEPDNCRWVSRNIQSVNQRIKRNNHSGHRGISITKSNTFAVDISHLGERVFRKTFQKLDDALIARNKFILDNNLPHNQEYL